MTISQSNVTDLLSLKGGETVYLMEDIDLAGIEWNSSVAFTGVFEGNNHKIKNLTTVTEAGFFKTLGGTVRNVAFTNVTLVAGTGALCYRGGTSATMVSNVFIEVAKTNSSASNRFGAICERQNNAATMNLTNVVIKMPGTAANEAILGYSTKGTSLSNVHCIGLPNEAASVQNAGTNFAGTYAFYTDWAAFAAASANVTLTDFLADCVSDYCNFILKITQENVTDLLTVTDKTVVLMEDIDLAGIEWNTTAAFSGVFEGNNHAIKNLTTVTGKGFFNTVQGTIRNVAFVDAFTGGNSAVIANKPTGTLSLENVFIDISGRGGWSGATLYTAGSAEFAANMTNVVVNFPAAQTNYNLFGYTLKGASTLTNVHVISGSGVYARMNDASKVYVKTGSTTYFHTDLSAFATANMTLTTFLDDCLAEYLNIVRISQANASKLLSLKGNETVVLTETIDVASIEWNSAVTFSGVFDGCNYAIKNLTTVAGNGFFKDINGATIRNVAFVDVTLPSNSGVITYRPTGGLTLVNAFIEVTSTGAGGRLGAICERSNNAVALNLTDVVISMPNTNANEAIYGYTLKGTSTLTNVHCIGLPNENASVQNAGTYFKGTYTLHTSLSAFNEANPTLSTDFLTNCVASYLNA